MPDDNRRRAPHGDRLEVRPAQASDIPALLEIEAQSFTSDKLSRRSFRRFVRSASAALLVACRGGAPVGYATILMRRGSQSARLYSIAVTAAETGRGVGSRLLAAAEAAAIRRRANRLRLEVRADNAAAIRFYTAKGYRQHGVRPGYYADGMSALLMARPLQAAATRLPARRLRRAA